ncbi:hypothetical protein BDV93DRAFT_553705, partial [Ceratobasidium sp. AG-I]
MSLAPESLSTSPSEPLSSSEINKLSDVRVWDMDPNIICSAARKAWRSDVYDHFDLSLERLLNDLGEKYIRFKSTCKTDPENHLPQYRNRQDTSSGTHNLQRKADACNQRHQVHKLANGSYRHFSPSRFRAILALWCARNHRPVELVQDELFSLMINELRPGVSLPDRTTITRDIRGIYSHNNVNYIHLVMDGWTAPTSRSYLGVVVVWESFGQLCRTILEFVHLPDAHKGSYLAQQPADCLNNNNNTFTEALRNHFPSFGGPIARIRCGAHIVNLMARAYLSVFSKQPQRKRALVESSETNHQAGSEQKRQRIEDNGRTPSTVSSNPSHDTNGQVNNDDDSEDEEDTTAADYIDDDKAEHDNAAVKACVERAFSEFERDY